VILTRSIATEWDRHQRLFAQAWRASMVRLDKVVAVEAPVQTALRERVNTLSVDDGVRAAIVKDVLLIEAALASDGIVVSLDEAMRGHLSRHARQLIEVQGVFWANPTVDHAATVAWFERGAPTRRA
jgi:hypothetical protein